MNLTISCFVLFFIIGMCIGVYIKFLDYKNTSSNFLVWEKASPPPNPREAVDWMLITTELSSRGYSKKQVKEIYRLRDTSQTSSNNPISLMFKNSNPPVLSRPAILKLGK